MSRTRFLLALVALLASCASLPEEDSFEEDVSDSASSEPARELGRKLQAATYNANCNQAQRDAIAAANLGVIWLSDNNLYNWQTEAHQVLRRRWFGSNATSAALDASLRNSLGAIRGLAVAGGPPNFACPSGCPVDMYAFTGLAQQVVFFCPDYWKLPHDSGDAVERSASRVGILAHEYAHYTRVAPLDVAFGPSNNSILAAQRPNDAVRNADSWRMYIMRI